jgi:hypothetical protein
VRESAPWEEYLQIFDAFYADHVEVSAVRHQQMSAINRRLSRGNLFCCEMSTGYRGGA